MKKGKEMDLELVWAVEKKPGKHVKLYMKNKQQSFSHKIEKPGRYSLIMHTPDFLPGGGAGRKVECLVSTFKNLSEPPSFKEAENLIDYSVQDASKEHLILHDTYEVHSSDATTVAEFELQENDVPGCIHMIAKTHTPFIGMRFAAKMYRNTNLDAIAEAEDVEFSPNSDWMYKSLSMEAIERELSRDTEEKQQAYELGMIRPFLALAAMHPVMRIQIGDLLGIKLIDLDGEEEWSYDPHKQALMLLDKHLKGLGSISDHSWETANPVSNKSNWYQCLYRGTTEVHPSDHAEVDAKKKPTSASMDHCKDASDDTIRNLETDFLIGARDIHLKEIKDLEGDSSILTDYIDQCEKDEDVKQIGALLKKHGFENEKICRFLVEISVVADFTNWLEYHKREVSKEEFKDESDEEKLKKWKADIENPETAKKREESYQTSHIVLAGLRAQLMKGTYDPRGLSEAGKAAAKKVGQMVAKKLFKYFVLVPMFPYLLLPWKIYGLLDKVIGSDHQTVWLVCLQISLQITLLAAHDISLGEYYKNMKDRD
jgi:hypothetical protein